MRQGLTLLSGCLLLAGSLSNHSWAAGFSYDDLTAAAAGNANAVVAGADDLSAAIYNPSGLAWQEGVQVMLGSHSRTRNMNVELGGYSHEGEGGSPDLTVFAVSWQPTGESWGVAGSIVTPYSLRTDWAAAFPGQLGETYLEMERYAIDTFWRASNTMGVSLGIDYYDSIARLNQGTASFRGSGWSDVGAHAGLRWEFAPFWVLGVTARQGADISFSGQDNTSLEMKLPDEVTVGLAHDFMDDEMRLELDIKRTMWSKFSDLNVTNSSGATTQSLTNNFKDSTDISLGSTWFWRNNTHLRFGYAYQDAANQAEDFQAAIADQVGHRFSMGFGGMMSGMHLDMTYAYVYHKDTDGEGTYAGPYSDAKSSFMFTLTKKF